MNTEDEVYRNLQKHLNRAAVGFPETKSGVEISLLKHLFTPEEAKIAMYLSTFAILDKAEKAGFVLQSENSRIPEAICCCCGDCCGLLANVIKSPRPVDLYASNYYVEVDPKLCKGCGTCIKRCQLEARILVNGIATVNLDRCIGCGNCVVTCETRASQLRKKDKEMIPFKDKDSMYRALMSRKMGKWNTFRAKVKARYGLQV